MRCSLIVLCRKGWNDVGDDDGERKFSLATSNAMTKLQCGLIRPPGHAKAYHVIRQHIIKKFRTTLI